MTIIVIVMIISYAEINQPFWATPVYGNPHINVFTFAAVFRRLEFSSRVPLAPGFGLEMPPVEKGSKCTEPRTKVSWMKCVSFSRF